MRCDLRTVKHSLQTVYPCCRSVRSVRSVRSDTWFIRTVTVRVYWTTHPASSPFFLAYFSFRFPYYLKACYRLTTCIPSFPIQLFMVYIQLERRVLLALCYWSAGLDLVVLTFQLLLDCETVIFFLSLFRLSFIFLCQFLSYFLDVFFASVLSLTHSPPPPAPDKSIQEGTTICFAPDHSFDYSHVLGLRKKYGLFFGLKFVLIDVLVS